MAPLSWLLIAVLAAPAPAPPAPVAAPAEYDPGRADADLELLLHERGRAYLEARARLEAHPAVVAPRIAERLRRVPAVTPAEEKRLLALLASVARPEDLEVFAAQLRREVEASHGLTRGAGNELRVAAPWRAMLREQGAAAAPALTGLVADRGLSEGLRALLLGDLVAVTPAEKLPDLVALVGAGAPALRQALRQALVRRAQASAGERAALQAAVDAGIAGSAGTRKASLIGLRAALGDGPDAAFTAAAVALAEDEAGEFAVRVAALRVLLARAADPAAQASLAKIAALHLEPARQSTQASELLGSLALQGLQPGAGRALVERHALTAAAAPRIAGAAYAFAPLSDDGAWLDASQQHPWPEVRGAALARIAGPCAAPMIKKVTRIADATGRRGEAEVIVAREAIAALGRCGGEAARKALVGLLGDGDQDGERRAEAARQLVKHHGRAGADEVAAALARTAAPSLSIRLVRALQRSEPPASPAVREALCEATEAAETAAAARQAIAALMADEDAPCGVRAAPERPNPEAPPLERE